MKERRSGPLAGATRIAEGMGATMRRLQREREPRILVYDASGIGRLVQPDARGYERMLELAQQMVELEAVQLAAAPDEEEENP